MRYFFSGKIEKEGDIYTIRIPFNVWEVCRQRGEIEGELVLDNKIVECTLLPEAKGIYKIHLQEEDVSHMDVTFGTPENYRTEFLRFEVANFDCGYNAIIGRLGLAKFMAIPHYTYMILKMPGPISIISIPATRRMPLSAPTRSTGKQQPQ